MKRADAMRRRAALGLGLALLAGCASTDTASEPDVAGPDPAAEEPVAEDEVTADAPGDDATDDAEAEAPAEDDEPTEVPADDEADEVEVSIGDFFFDPETTSVSVGDTIIWTHGGDITHNVTARDESFASDNLTVGDTFSHTFDTAGSFEYRCTLHGQMVATVEVS